MNDPTPPAAQRLPDLGSLIGDESLTALRQAYHAAERFQLSAEHQAVKITVQNTLRSSAKPLPQVGQ
jgi:hypothetical protein